MANKKILAGKKEYLAYDGGLQANCLSVCWQYGVVYLIFNTHLNESISLFWTDCKAKIICFRVFYLLFCSCISDNPALGNPLHGLSEHPR